MNTVWKTVIESNNAIIEDCNKLINEHNEFGYLKIKTHIPQATNVSFQKSNAFIEYVHDFYTRIMNATSASDYFDNLSSSMNYSMEDLIVKIDRSTSYIMETKSKMDRIRDRMIEFVIQIKHNNKLCCNEFIRFLHDEHSNMSYTIEQDELEFVFKCANTDHRFITYGVSILCQLLEDKLINESYKELISKRSNELKLSILTNNEKHEHRRLMLQTFNLFPTVNNLTIKQMIKTLFHIDIRSFTTFDDLQDVINRISTTSLKQVALIVIARSNANDIYFNMDTLFDRNIQQTITSKSGVNQDYIDAFFNLKYDAVAKKIANDIHVISSANDMNNSDEIYLTWTNDYINFKVREIPVSKNIATKLVNNKSSQIVSLRNAKFEKNFLNAINNTELVSYKQVKYLAFNMENEEVAFIDTLFKDIESYIIKRSSKEDLSKTLVASAITTVICLTYDAFKPFHMKGDVPIHAKLMYDNIAVRIGKRIREDIVIWAYEKKPNSDLKSIIMSRIGGSDNIYTKFISSYYLDQSGV